MISPLGSTVKGINTDHLRNTIIKKEVIKRPLYSLEIIKIVLNSVNVFSHMQVTQRVMENIHANTLSKQ